MVETKLLARFHSLGDESDPLRICTFPDAGASGK
jgi:hypothetical protein